MYYIQLSLALNDSIVHCQECFLYTYTGVGLSALLVSTNWAMPEPLHVERVTEQAPRFSYVLVSGFRQQGSRLILLFTELE